VRLFLKKPVGRFVGLVALLFIAIPFGMSVSGCKKALPVEYCDAGDSGPEVGQVASITLSPTLATVGESLNYGQIGQGLQATALDCKGNAVSVSRYTYATTNMAIADINPSTGSVCGGTWNRNTGGGVQDYTTCTAPTTTPSPTTTALSLTTPTASSAGTASTTTLTLANPFGSISGTLSLALGTGAVHSITVAGPTLAALATQIANDATYTAEGITANYNATTSVLTISGPATASSTLVPTGTVLIEISDISAFVTATAGGAVSNSIPIYIHPTVVSVALGNASANCSTDPTTTCCPITTTTIYNPVPQPYNENSCVSQGQTAQLVARVYQANTTTVPYPISNGSVSSTYGTTTFIVSGTSAPAVGTDITLTGFGGGATALNNQTVMVEASQTATLPYTITVDSAFGLPNGTATGAGTVSSSINISCQVGHLTYSLLTASNIATIDQNGVVTADQPGSSLLGASVSNSGSAASAGFFSTCPPASITLSLAGSTTTTASVNLNNAQPLTATVIDTLGNPLTGVSLEFESTTPQTAPGAAGTITPVFPGTAAITALCQPGTCNPAPFSQIGFQGNGQPIQSNSVTINTTGTSSTAIYMASTQSQYVLPMDFSTGLQSSPVKLPYVPNSMVISLDGSELYFGSPQGLMSITTANNSVTGANVSLPGTVLAISPDGSTLVITDPTRQTISLYSTASASVTTIIGGIGTRAVWSPDSQTVYITTTTNTLLTHTNFTNWQSTSSNEIYTDAAVMVPSIGAYFAGGSLNSTGVTTDARSYCASVTQSTGGPPPSETNTFAPLADTISAITDKLAATNVGQHILGAHAATGAGASTFTDIQFTFPTVTSNGIVTPKECPIPPATVTSPGYFTDTPTTTPVAGGINATAITGVFPTSGQAAPLLTPQAGNIAALTNETTFVTYTGTGGQLLEYTLPSTGGAGTLSYVPLAGSATAPISGVWSTDNTTFYTGTSGDNEVHEITESCTNTQPGAQSPVYSCIWKDSGQLTPNLPSATGTGNAPVNLIAQRPKKVTS